MEKSAKIYIAGHRGMVGSAIARQLRAAGYFNVVGRTFQELDLRVQADVEAFFAAEKPDYVFLAAAKVGGIMANNVYRGEFIYENLMIQNNVIHQAHVHGVKKLMFLGSSCIYPKLAPQPMREDMLLTGPLEPTNEPYAIAKIAGIKLCEAYRDQYGDQFIYVMPTNLYGPNDNYDLESSHVFPALIRKFFEAARDGRESVYLWGDGSPRREFLHVDDMAAACIHLMHTYNDRHLVNIGTGEDVTIRELAEKIAESIGYRGQLSWDTDKPNGTPRKLLDVSRLHALGFRHRISLEEGIERTINDFAEHYAQYVG
ncbi:MAG: GDP-L-fucose synthase [Bacteroidota bacterium]